MPFNEQGDWVTVDPLELYKSRVYKSKSNPGGGGRLWNEDERHKLHNDATFYVLKQRGIDPTRENFDKMREEIGREVEDEYDMSEREGHEVPLLPPQYSHELRSRTFYKLEGD